jgi:hypothetical protein
MRLLKFIYLLLLLLLIPILCHAQVNTEALRVDAGTQGFQGNLRLTGNISAGNTSIYEMNAGGRVDHLRGNNRAFVVGDLRYGYKNGARYRNSAFIAVRNTGQWRPRLAHETFAQQQMDEFIRLKDRKLLGAGVRITAIDVENAAALRFRTFLGIGAMAEREIIESRPGDPNFVTTLLRSTNYLSLTLGRAGVFYISAVQYLQFVPDRTTDYRYTADVNVDANLSRAVSLLFTLSYRRDNEPPAGIRPFDLSYTTGLRYRF